MVNGSGLFGLLYAALAVLCWPKLSVACWGPRRHHMTDESGIEAPRFVRFPCSWSLMRGKLTGSFEVRMGESFLL